jgi:amino acid adenylation domain-containing protein
LTLSLVIKQIHFRNLFFIEGVTMNLMRLHEQISRLAEKYPEKVAIDYSEPVTYQLLEVRSNQVSNCLSQPGQAGKKVLLFLNKTPWFIISLIGVMKSGGIFVPVDINFPVERILAISDEVDVAWVIAETALIPKLHDVYSEKKEKPKVLIIDPENLDKVDSIKFDYIPLDYSGDQGRLFIQKALVDPCYIYFTSGSTGKPKGILGRHSSLTHFIEWEINEFKTENFRVSQLTTPTFDPFLRDVFVPLCSGGTVCMPEKTDFLVDPLNLLNWLDAKRIQLVHMVPTLFKMLSAAVEDDSRLNALRYILLAGELLRGNNIKHFLKIFKNKIQLVNVYGPTETTLAKFFYKINENDAERNIIPVGNPIPDTEALILDNRMKKTQVGAVGEVYIRTPYMSCGYINDMENTKKVFIPNPLTGNPDDIIYKTGDLGKRYPSGEIEVVGRIDNQVKIRGIRVELGEIENTILTHPEIIDAAVLSKEDKEAEEQNNFLCLYYVSKQPLDISELKSFLHKTLPDYMIPKYFTRMESFPLTTSGKIDQKAFPEPNKEVGEATISGATGETERNLLDIWCQVLNISLHSLDSNFFEVGGTSLDLIKIHQRIDALYPGKVQIADLFSYPTIIKLAEYIDSYRIIQHVQIPSLTLEEKYFASINEVNTFKQINQYIEINLLNQIMSLCNQEGINIEALLTGMFIFLLGKISNAQRVAISVICREEQVSVIQADLTKTDDFLELFRAINQQLQEDSNLISFKTILDIHLEKFNSAINPLICRKELLAGKTAVLNEFDLVLEIDSQSEQINLIITSCSGKIRTEFLEMFSENYINSIQSLITNYTRFF